MMDCRVPSVPSVSRTRTMFNTVVVANVGTIPGVFLAPVAIVIRAVVNIDSECNFGYLRDQRRVSLWSDGTLP